MKKLLLSITLMIAGFALLSAQQTTLEVPIKATGETDSVDVEYDDGARIEWVTVQLSSDDAEQENDEIDTFWDDDLDAGWEGDPEDLNVVHIGLRFRDITVPKGATIDSAYIIFCSHEPRATTDVATIEIYGEATDNAETYEGDALITARPRTTAMVTWVDDTEWGLYTFHKTADISVIIQEIVDRDGWVSGNALNLMCLGVEGDPSDDLNSREIEAFENIADPGDGGDGKNHPERVPRLRIVYSETTDVENVSGVKFTVYPNPANEVLHVNLNSDNPSTVGLYDIAGKMVEEYSFNTSKINIDVRNYERGVYMLKVEQAQNTYTRKIVIE